MKKIILTGMLATMLAFSNLVPVWATEVPETAAEAATEATAATEETSAAETSEGDAAGTAAEGDVTEAETTGAVINPDNYVDVEAIDLSLHVETTGEFTPVYMYDNPFMGKDTSQGVIFEFYAKPTWEVHELGAIFAVNGTGDYDGKLYFSPGSYLGFNSTNFGGYFDANLYSYKIVNDYIKDGAKIRIEITADGFAVYSNDVLCYDQTILANPEAGAGDYTAESDFAPVLEWLAGAETLYFGYGSWWNEAGSNEANINLSQVSFRMMDGTVVMDKLQADKVLIESLGGSTELKAEVVDGAASKVQLADVNVEIFDINSVQYEADSILIPMVMLVVVVAVVAAGIIVMALKKRDYDDI